MAAQMVLYWEMMMVLLLAHHSAELRGMMWAVVLGDCLVDLLVQGKVGLKVEYKV